MLATMQPVLTARSHTMLRPRFIRVDYAVGFLRECECRNGIVSQRRIKETACRRCNNDVLLAVLTQICNRRGVRCGGKFDGPKLLACFRVECAEAAVIGGADEDQSACSGDGPAAIRPSRILFIRRQSVCHS